MIKRSSNNIDINGKWLSEKHLLVDYLSCLLMHVWFHKTNLTSLNSIEVHVPSLFSKLYGSTCTKPEK